MALPVVYRRKVGRDLADGYAWYEGQRPGRFLNNTSGKNINTTRETLNKSPPQVRWHLD